MARLTKEQKAKKDALLRKKARIKPDIATWKPTEDQILIEQDKKIFLVHFDKIFKKEKYKQYARFMIDKTSYTNHLQIITDYANYFMNKYDDDNELAMSYLKIKMEMDKYRYYTKDNMNELIDVIYDLIFSDSMVGKIAKLVEDNYLDDIETNDSDGKYKTYAKQYLESLEFTNVHVQILLAISFGMKLMCPIVLHYVHLNQIKLDSNSDILFQFYRRLFTVFGGDIDIYNKLFTYIKTKVIDNHVHNVRIYDQREIMGTDEYHVIKKFLRKVIISENMMKYKFNTNYDVKLKKYKENVIGFNKTIVKYQLSYFLREQYSKTITEVTNSKNAEGLSGADKLSMNLSKVDQGASILSKINTETTYDYIIQDFDLDVTEEEIDYYVANARIDLFQAMIIRNFFASFFGNIRDIQRLNRRQFYHLSLLLKKFLIMQDGYNPYVFHGDTCPLAYMLTGNMGERLNNRVIRNVRFNSSLMEDELYQYLINHQYSHLSELYPDDVKKLISSFINTQFNYVAYEAPEMLGKEIVFDDVDVSRQLLQFIHYYSC